jgi:hypothetical protein
MHNMCTFYCAVVLYEISVNCVYYRNFSYFICLYKKLIDLLLHYRYQLYTKQRTGTPEYPTRTNKLKLQLTGVKHKYSIYQLVSIFILLPAVSFYFLDCTVCLKPVLWIRNDFFRIRILLFSWFRIQHDFLLIFLT